MFYLKAMFPSPPACVFFRRHVYHWHNVTHLASGHKCKKKKKTVKHCSAKKRTSRLLIYYMIIDKQYTVSQRLPQRSTRLWPGLCNVWWRGQQQWQGHWLRLLQTPADGFPCCQSKNKKPYLISLTFEVISIVSLALLVMYGCFIDFHCSTGETQLYCNSLLSLVWTMYPLIYHV